MTIANAVEKATKEGKDLSIPYWRTLESEDFLKEKYPVGVEVDKRLLEEEGSRVRQRDKEYIVEIHQVYLK